jgi:LL-H family phage holin
MNTQELLSDLIILLLPIIIAVALWLYRLLEQRLPEKQRAILDYFVKIAVQCVEATNAGTGIQKKNAAIMLITAFFSTLRLPVPSSALIDAAIDAAVFEMKSRKIPDALANSGINTGPIKPIGG